MSDALWKLSATELSQGYRAGTFRPSQVLVAILERIAVVDPKLNVFAVLDVEGAKAAAADSDARFEVGQSLGAFDGIPVTIKDNINVKGLRCAWGSNLYLDQISAEDELPVARLRAQGPSFWARRTCRNSHLVAAPFTRLPSAPAGTPGTLS